MVRSGYRSLFVHNPAFLGPAVLAIVFASRLPILTPGYGNDPDGWLVIKTARQIAEKHEYVASRLPGFPVPEFVYSMIWCVAHPLTGGPSPIVVNGLTALLSVVAVAFFMRALRRLGVADAAWAGLALGLTPVIAIASTTSMDFIWGLAFILAAFDFILADRPRAAGILLGLAVGCRITSGAMLVPLGILAWMRAEPHRRTGRLVTFVACTILVAAACFAPVIARYGPGFFTFAEASFRPSTGVAFYRGTIRVWGLVGCLGLAGMNGASVLTRGWRNPASASQRGIDLATCFAIGLYLIAYVRHPAKAEYLIPAVPFVILLLARLTSRRQFQVACGLVCISSFLVGVGSGGTPTPVFSGTAIQTRVAGIPLMIDLPRGPLLLAQAERRYRDDYIDHLLAMGATLPGNGVVVVGYWLHQIELMRPDTRKSPEYIYTLTGDELSRRRAAGDTIYYLPEMAAFNVEVTGFDLAGSGATPLKPR